MFNFDDLNIPRDTNNKIPDGIQNELEFAIIMQNVLSTLKNTDFSNFPGRERLSMQIINIACDSNGELDEDRSISVILSLIQHTLALINSIKNMNDESVNIDSYFEYFQTNIVDPLMNDPNIPYYKETDEV